MKTDPLTGSRYPELSDSSNLAQYFQNAVWDLADNAIPRFSTTTARDAAYSTWVAAGNTLANGMVCAVGDQLYKYRVSVGWQALSGESYYATAAGGITITTANLPSAPASSTAQLTLPPGIYDFEFSARFSLSTDSASREITLVLEHHTIGQLASPFFTVNAAGGTASREVAYFTRAAVNLSSNVVYLRTRANATGGTQQMTSNQLRARRVG